MSKPQKDQKGNVKSGQLSRRSVIVKLLKEGTWTKETLAKKLQEVNKDWPVVRNKSAISGTLADLRKKPQQWTVSVSDKGVIGVKEKAAS